ncbi:hypothetical protein PR202_gb16439 [Eleusine coracana subsp. coracana]|uniref:At1g61320/AtMIF1 LRR domain-containing protein n=1 Tax=Eleusine coracana subsp. coracana TaxID=191504 RepID=A0AAV5EY46_ELECO|nr:hypothetical protein PR202_gb16439 [Eleusine coracana subsp. coracana]
MWSICPRLTFDAVHVCKCDRDDLHKHTEEFINEVNAVLQKHQDKVVETLEVRIDFVNSRLLADHINNWINFAVSSRTKNLTLDLKPKKFREYDDRYVFPFQLFDGGTTMSHIRHMQLSFVALDDPPSHFRGFPNLRKLHLQEVRFNGKDLGHVLSRCCNLEWLCIDRCDELKDGLIVDAPLTHLLYLRVEYCIFTRMNLHAANLATFDYNGPFIPIDLTNSLKLQTANIELEKAIFQHAFTSLLNGLPSVQNLTLKIGLQYLEKQWLWDNRLQFYNLRRFQLFMLIFREGLDKVLCSILFLRATPFIEELEVHFAGYTLWLAEVGPCRKDLGPPYKYNYLKNICITGFKAARGQLEFLLHLVENAPALEVINIKIGDRHSSKEFWPCEGRRPPFEEAKRIVRDCLLTLNVKFDITY